LNETEYLLGEFSYWEKLLSQRTVANIAFFTN